MTIYRGRVGCRDFMSKLKEIFELEGYEQVSSYPTDDGWIYKSVGSTGEDEFYVRFQDPSQNYITVGVYEKYIPNETIGLPGVFENGQDHNCIYWNHYYSYIWDRIELDYIININLDRAIVFVEGMKREGYTARSLTYIGLPIRYDDKDREGKFAGIAYTGKGVWDQHMVWRPLRNRASSPLSADYTMQHYGVARSYGWGGNIFFSPLFIQSATEGPRGRIDGVFVSEHVDENHELRHGDEFEREGKRYFYIVPTRSGNDTFYHHYDYVMEL